MKIHYQIRVQCKDEALRNIPITVAVGDKITGKITWAQPLCNNAIDSEKLWYKEQIEGNMIKCR